MSFIVDQRLCENADDWWIDFDEDCCRWNQGDRRCNNWWQNNPDLLDDIGQGPQITKI